MYVSPSASMNFGFGAQLLISSFKPKQRTSHSRCCDRSTGSDSHDPPINLSLRKKSLSLYISGNSAELFVRGCATHIMLWVSLIIFSMSSDDPMWYTVPYPGTSSLNPRAFSSGPECVKYTGFGVIKYQCPSK